MTDPIDDEFPDLLTPGSRAIRAAIAARIPAYTPEWTPAPGAADPGVALVKVFGEQAAGVVDRVNRLPEKFRREELRIAGLRGRPAGIATVMLVLTVSDTAPDPVLIPAGSRLVVPGAGQSDQVVFETIRDLYATAAAPALYVTAAGIRAVPVEIAEMMPGTPVLVLGRRPQPGSAWWIGLSGPRPHPRLTLEIELAPGASLGPLPVTMAPPGAGLAPAVVTGEPVISWELLTDEGLVPAQLWLDETRGLQQSGMVEIGIGNAWAPVHHPALPPDPPHPPLRWLRAVLRYGQYEQPPAVAAVRLNTVRADGAETIRGEVLEPVPAGPARGSPAARQFRLARTPVLPGTVRLVVDAPDPADLFDLGSASGPSGPAEWTEVPSLARSQPYERHFVLDEATGIVTFGDGVRGAAVPAGFRNVQALSYRTGGGAAYAVPASAGFVLRDTVPNLTGVDNPYPAQGGQDAEPVERTVGRGPGLLRSRNTVVTGSDAEVIASGAGAGVGRVLALAGRDADGTSRPGQLTLLVAGDQGEPAHPPVVGEPVLRQVAELVAGDPHPLSVLGSTVVVRPARFALVELDLTIRIGPGADGPAAVRAVAAAVDDYLHPVTGGDDGDGWPLGQAISYQRIIAVAGSAAGVDSVARMLISVSGRAGNPCQDAVIPAHTLPWPGRHTILPLSAGGPS